MPEVVEVAFTALYLKDRLVGKKITGVEVLGGRYSRHPLQGLVTLKDALPVTILNVESKGKFMYFEVQNSRRKKYYILNTFGLEGNWGFNRKKHSGVSFCLDNGETLYFTDSRNFGTLVFTAQKDKLIDKLKDIAPDFLKESFTNDEFHQRIKNYIINKKGTINNARKNKKIVQVLMEQKAAKALGSGIGNYLAVEILYDARMSPHKTIYEIYSDKKLSDQLAKSIKYIIKLSFETAENGYMGRLTDDMDKFVKKLRREIKKDKKHENNYHRRTGLGNHKFDFLVYRQKKDPDGNPIKGERDIIKGRTTYWSPIVQK